MPIGAVGPIPRLYEDFEGAGRPNPFFSGKMLGIRQSSLKVDFDGEVKMRLKRRSRQL